jgi:NarL family two-component system response regulator LiaR
MSPTTKVLLVDDHEMLTDSLALRLSCVSGLVMLDRYSTTDPTLMNEVAILRPDVTTVDVEAVGPGTGTFIAGLLNAWPKGRVVVLTASKDSDLAVSAVRAGAASWVDKTGSIEELVEVLRGVVKGYAWYPPRLLGDIIRALRSDAQGAGVDRRPVDNPATDL